MHFFLQNLAAEKTYNNLDVTLKEANDHRNEWFEGVHTCKRTDTLYKVMETIVKAEVHRLVIVNDDKKVCGVVSLSDILSYLVLRPTGKLLVLFYVMGIFLWDFASKMHLFWDRIASTNRMGQNTTFFTGQQKSSLGNEKVALLCYLK